MEFAMTRKAPEQIDRRPVTPSRESAITRLAVQADLDASRGHDALSRGAMEVFSRVGDAINRRARTKLAEQADADQTAGAAARTQETVEGKDAQSAEQLAGTTETYRRGYFLTEAANRVQEARLNLSKRIAALRPGDDPRPIIQEEMGSLLTRPEFQDATVRKQLAPALQTMQGQVLELHQKVELAEIVESQAENLRALARADITSGTLRTAEGIQRFRAALNNEQFGYLDEDEADAIAAESFADLLASGEVDPEETSAFLKQRVGDRAALWDQGDNADRFQTAARAGTAIRERAREEAQANAQAQMEPLLQERSGRGALSTAEVYKVADSLALDGKQRLSFVRHWIDQNQAGQRRLESEAKEAARHRQVLTAINAGAALTHTSAELSKAAQRDWAAAVQSGDQRQKSAVIARYTKAGVVVPQLKDLLSRTTRSNLTESYDLYAALTKLDPVVADRYLSDENATLFAQYHDNRFRFGMTPQDALAAVPTGANKGRRQDVSSGISKAATAYFKANPEMPDGSPRPHWINTEIERRAVQLGMAAPDASPEVNLQVAERQIIGSSIKVNGQWTRRGGARKGAEPAIEEYVRGVAKDAVDAGMIDAAGAEGLRAGPHPQDPNVFVVLRQDGLPLARPNGRMVLFDPNVIAAMRLQYAADKAEHDVRRARGERERKVERRRMQGEPWVIPGQAPPSDAGPRPLDDFPSFGKYILDNEDRARGLRSNPDRLAAELGVR